MQPNLHEAARGFLLAHQGEHLQHDKPLLVNRCADHLKQHHGAHPERAMVVAVQVMGEVESRGNATHVDLSASTSFAVFVRDQASGLVYAFTAAELQAIGRNLATARANALH